MTTPTDDMIEKLVDVMNGAIMERCKDLKFSTDDLLSAAFTYTLRACYVAIETQGPGAKKALRPALDKLILLLQDDSGTVN